jgi:hypothetical protein
MRQKIAFDYLVGTLLRGVLIATMITLLCLSVPMHAEEANQAQVVSGPDFKIVIQSVEKSGTLNGQPLYTLSFRFDFNNRDKIFLQDFGDIGAHGEISYLSTSKVVDFWSSEQKQRLTTVKFQETGASRGEADEMPAPREFPSVKRQSAWPRNLPAQLTVLKVVNKYYPTGAHPWIEHDTQFFETVYKPLGSLPRGILGRVALRISFPTVPNSDPYNIDVQAAIQERRRLEDWRSDNISPETSSSAETFLGLFAADLEKASGSQ